MGEMKQTPDVMLTRVLFELGAGDKPTAFAIYEGFKKEVFADEQEKAFYLARAAEALDLRAGSYFLLPAGCGRRLVPARNRQAERSCWRCRVICKLQRNTLASLRNSPDPAVVEQSWLLEARLFQQFGTSREALQSLDQALVELDTSIPIRYAHIAGGRIGSD
ncbi:MAG: hypothetical protein MZV65_20925 [Chromatiales bacterium]|nr:hypothetical protein [Chromatiales bacterium]